MKTFQTLMVALYAFVLLIGCAGKGPDVHDMPEQKSAARPETPMDLPDWFINTPEEDDTYVYATGTGESRKMNYAIQKATQNAQVELSQRIKATVLSKTKNFAQEAGMDENTQIVEFYQTTSEVVTSNAINGMTILKKYPYMKSGGSYVAYVQVGLRKDAIDTEVVSAIKNEEALYAQFKASMAFKELEDSVGKSE